MEPTHFIINIGQFIDEILNPNLHVPELWNQMVMKHSYLSMNCIDSELKE